MIIQEIGHLVKLEKMGWSGTMDGGWRGTVAQFVPFMKATGSKSTAQK
jgi:hypothetical protein